MSYKDALGIGPRTSIRKCQVCSLPPEKRDAFERAMRGERQADGRFLTVQATERDLQTGIDQPLLSRHKKDCMGLAPRPRGTRLAAPPKSYEEQYEEEKRKLADCPPDRALAVIPPKVPETALVAPAWVPTEMRDWARNKLVAAIKELDAKIAEGATAAFFAVRLEHLKLLLAESEKTGGSPADRQKSYEEELRQNPKVRKLIVSRTMTMTETTVSEDAPSQIIEGTAREIGDQEPAGEAASVGG